MIWLALMLLGLDVRGLSHDACVRSVVLYQAERSPRPVAWGDARTWGACWRSPGACAVDGCP